MQLNVLQVGRQEELTADPRNDRQTDPRLQPAAWADRHRRRRRSSPGACRRDPGAEFKYQREYPTGDLFANITGYYTFNYGSTQIERTQSDVLAGNDRATELERSATCSSGDDNTGSRGADAAHRRAAGRQGRARRAARDRSS